jgi:signal transduction histidine kinase
MGPDNAELNQCAGRIRETAGRMIEMVQNLLDANRIERGEMKLEVAPTDLAALVSSVIENQRPRATAKQQQLYLEAIAGPVPALVDAEIMVQVLENLVSNAIKYSPSGKSIFVRLSRFEDAVRLEVRDEGPGLSAEDQKKLFGKFARLSAKPTGGEHSTGLGLSIVKKMVEAMHGRVWCESNLGKGAVFIVELSQAA